jgi:hypothetical protein
MFDSPFEYRKADVRKGALGNQIDYIIIYTFDTGKCRYIVEVEHYDHNFYIVKYYPKKCKNYKYRFNILTSEYIAPRIIATCLRIIESITKKDPAANFGFVGSPTVMPEMNWREGQANTKRFRLYKYAFESYFGHEMFTHYMNVVSSVYLIINNGFGDPDDLMPVAAKMFVDIYPELLQ